MPAPASPSPVHENAQIAVASASAGTDEGERRDEEAVDDDRESPSEKQWQP
jgi:hypothetical protein